MYLSYVFRISVFGFVIFMYISLLIFYFFLYKDYVFRISVFGFVILCIIPLSNVF